MDPPNQLKVKQVCFRIALLMEHQEVLEDLKEVAVTLQDGGSSEYLQGAQDALTYLIFFLEQKGCPNISE